MHLALLAHMSLKNFCSKVTLFKGAYIYIFPGPGHLFICCCCQCGAALINSTPDRPISGYNPTVQGPPVNVDIHNLNMACAHILALKVPPCSSHPPTTQQKTRVHPTLTSNCTPPTPLAFNPNYMPITTTTVCAYAQAAHHAPVLPPALAAHLHRFTAHSEQPHTHPRQGTGTPHHGHGPVLARDIPYAAQPAHDADTDMACATAAARALHACVRGARSLRAP